MTARAAAILTVACALLYSVGAMSAEGRYSARELYALVHTGIPLLERRADGDLLHLRDEPLSQRETEKRAQLESLGYVDALGTETEPSIELRIDHSAAKLSRIAISAERWAGERCSARAVVFSSEGAKLFSKEWMGRELTRAVSGKRLVATPALAASGEKMTVSVQIFRCRPVLREIVLR